VTIPTYNLDLLPPRGMEIDTPGSSIDPPRALSGLATGIDFAGGGLWTVTYRGIGIFSRQSHRHFNRLRMHLTGGVQAIVIPLVTDYIAPTITDDGPIWIEGITHSDGSLHSDGAGYREATIKARLNNGAALNASTVRIKVDTGGELIGGEIFSLYHPIRGYRCYQIGEIDDVVPNGGEPIYTVEIKPPLREASTTSDSMRFVRPLLTVRLAPGAKMPWAPSDWWEFEPDVSFIEAF
jgi:hypothetical protein